MELQEACVKLGIEFTLSDADWQLALRIVRNWNGSKFSEVDDYKEPKIVLASIIACVPFPNLALQTYIVGRAEELASEIFNELEFIDAHNDYFYFWLLRNTGDKIQRQSRLFQ